LCPRCVVWEAAVGPLSESGLGHRRGGPAGSTGRPNRVRDPPPPGPTRGVQAGPLPSSPARGQAVTRAKEKRVDSPAPGWLQQGAGSTLMTGEPGSLVGSGFVLPTEAMMRTLSGPVWVVGVRACIPACSPTRRRCQVWAPTRGRSGPVSVRSLPCAADVVHLDGHCP
jgi:hypothetical protein